MPGWWRRGNFENCDNLIDLLISEKELRQNHRVQFQFIEMIHPNRLENDSIMAPVAQEAETIELSLEQLEGIQGGGRFRQIICYASPSFLMHLLAKKI
jgi:hypothetical protein